MTPAFNIKTVGINSYYDAGIGIVIITGYDVLTVKSSNRLLQFRVSEAQSTNIFLGFFKILMTPDIQPIAQDRVMQHFFAFFD